MEIEKSLMKGEAITAKAEISKLPLIVAGLLALLTFIVSFAVYDETHATIVLVLGVVFALFIILSVAAKISSTFLCVTNKRVIGEVGFLKKQSLDLPLAKVNSVSTEITLLGQLLNYSTIVVSSSSGSMYFKMIRNAEDIRRACLDPYDVPLSEDTCPHCKSRVYGNPKFCPSCGRSLIPDKPRKICCGCGKEIDADTVFCPYCGQNNSTADKPEPKETCPSCGKGVTNKTNVCPYCGYLFFSDVPSGKGGFHVPDGDDL